MADLAAILLAAGASQRFGPANKLLVRVGGRPLVRGIAEEILESGVADVTVVTGCEAAAIRDALAGLAVRCVHNDRWQMGMGSSIACGAKALGSNVAGAFIVPADMPFLKAGLFRDLARAFERHDAQMIVYPVTTAGEQRNPVLWPQRYFPALAALSGPQGGRSLLQSSKAECVAEMVGNDAFFADIDTPAELTAAQSAWTQVP